MGATGALFKIGLMLVAVGFVVSLVVPPLGFLLGRLGLVLIGGALLLPILGLGLVAVFALTASTSTKAGSDGTPSRPSGTPRRDTTAGTRQSNTGAESGGPATAGTEQPDLDVDSIDDYRR